MKQIPCRLILASASPRRHQILRDAGYAFDIVDPGEVEDEVRSAPTPEALAEGKAAAKARHVAKALNGAGPALVIGVDTLVAAGPDVIGKPLDRPDAIRILTRLSGTRHRVISGFCLLPIPCGEACIGNEATWVTMRPMAPAEIHAYVASGEADGKAGAYAIQETGDAYVEKLEGSFLNVVGFPLETFERTLPAVLKKLGH
jgi:septum formation protein